ncbi:unnamed protein product, partial [Rhizoctonia solani]
EKSPKPEEHIPFNPFSAVNPRNYDFDREIREAAKQMIPIREAAPPRPSEFAPGANWNVPQPSPTPRIITPAVPVTHKRREALHQAPYDPIYPPNFPVPEPVFAPEPGGPPIEFDGREHVYKTISHIYVVSDDYISRIAVEPLGIFTLHQGEEISHVMLGADEKYISNIQFLTNMGRASRRFGGRHGRLHFLSGDGGSLGAIGGSWFGIWINRLKARAPLRDDQRLISHYVGAETGGQPFNDYAYMGDPQFSMIGQISISIAPEEEIQSIQVTFNHTRGNVIISSPAPRHGAWGGKEYIFPLMPGEYIIQVEVKSGECVNQLCFVTNTGRRSQVVGTMAGTAFQCQPIGHFKARPALKFLAGHSETHLNGLMFVWAFPYDSETGYLG